ncbi:uncharacterized protein LOC131613269 [Vicia villosa]|uniref:uncharacterized protein LOC131613269 n=1 Tax=Vicia villosa TaxID=3911 RepID=UPI00273CBC5F|nr:uncharacterized protein LOC131613269 [Vicia villosa]
MDGRNDAAIAVALEAMAPAFEHQSNHYDGPTGEFSKCIKFENGLRFEIKKVVGYQKMRVFADLVDSCRIYEEDNNVHYRAIREKRGNSQQSRGKPYDDQVGKGKQKATEGKRTSGVDVPAGIVCFKCCNAGHKSNVCTVDTKRGTLVASVRNQRRNKLVERLGLVLSSMNGEMVVDSLSKGSVTTSLVCLKCPVLIFDIDFVVDFSVRFSTPEEEGVELLSARQLRLLMKEEVQVFALVASLSIENQAIIDELQVVREFPEVFPDEIVDVPPEREV